MIGIIIWLKYNSKFMSVTDLWYPELKIILYYVPQIIAGEKARENSIVVGYLSAGRR